MNDALFYGTPVPQHVADTLEAYAGDCSERSFGWEFIDQDTCTGPCRMFAVKFGPGCGANDVFEFDLVGADETDACVKMAALIEESKTPTAARLFKQGRKAVDDYIQARYAATKENGYLYSHYTRGEDFVEYVFEDASYLYWHDDGMWFDSLEACGVYATQKNPNYEADQIAAQENQTAWHEAVRRGEY